MTKEAWLLALIALANAAGAILAWCAKLRWSKEYRNATDRLLQSKDEIIRAKDAEVQVLQRQISHLERLNPKELFEWFEGMKKLSVEYTDGIKIQLDSANLRIKELESSGREKDDRLIEAKADIAQLSVNYQALKHAVDQHILPPYETFVTSAAASSAVSDSSSVTAPKVNVILSRIWAEGGNFNNKMTHWIFKNTSKAKDTEEKK